MDKDTCNWSNPKEEFFADDRLFYTDCGEEFMLNDGDPKSNGFKYCCYCGRPINPKQDKE